MIKDRQKEEMEDRGIVRLTEERQRDQGSRVFRIFF